MKRSNRLVLLIGVFLAVVAFVGIIIVLSRPGGPSTAQPSAPVQLSTVVAARDIPLGSVLQEDMLTTQTLPVTQRKAGAFEIPSQVVGQTVRRAITSGAQLSTTDFLDSAVNFQVPPGQRAIAVQVDAITGVGTLIKTGDYVDMIVALTGDKFPVVSLDPDTEAITVVAGLNSTSVKLLLDGIQVLGTIRPPTAPATAQQPAASGASAAPPTTTLTEENQELVLLSVTAQQAEVIKFVQIDGNISLVLRSPADFVDENGEPIVSLPPGTTGIILKTLVDGGYGVLRPELVEAILPAQ